MGSVGLRRALPPRQSEAACTPRWSRSKLNMEGLAGNIGGEEGLGRREVSSAGGGAGVGRDCVGVGMTST